LGAARVGKIFGLPRGSVIAIGIRDRSSYVTVLRPWRLQPSLSLNAAYV
jgi:hypothetical protein